jgi:hypothetical protein
MVESWMILRGLHMCPPDLLPIHGLINGLCAGWIIQTDTNVAYLEPLISHPECPKEDLDDLIKALINLAKSLGYEYLSATTTLSHVVALANKHGFQASTGNYTHLAIKL